MDPYRKSLEEPFKEPLKPVREPLMGPYRIPKVVLIEPFQGTLSATKPAPAAPQCQDFARGGGGSRIPPWQKKRLV